MTTESTNAVRAVDPPGCGCTDCLISYSVPLQNATAEHVTRMLRGRLQDRTAWAFSVTAEQTSDHGEPSITVTGDPGTWEQIRLEWSFTCTPKRLSRIAAHPAVTHFHHIRHRPSRHD